jgi:hypothetical protein
MNVYEMYYENNKNFGFWIKRNSWGYSIAKVISIEGVTEGEDIPGYAPYYSNPKVIAEFYKETNKDDCHSGNLEDIIEISCPGNYSYYMC